MSPSGDRYTAAALSDELIAKARVIASRSDELLKLLEDARQRLVDPTGKVEPKQRSKAEPEPATKKGSGTGGVSEGLRLLATQMSVAGATHEEIAGRLREEFGVTDPESILKRVGL
jgi:hypothetical protein